MNLRNNSQVPKCSGQGVVRLRIMKWISIRFYILEGVGTVGKPFLVNTYHYCRRGDVNLNQRINIFNHDID